MKNKKIIIPLAMVLVLGILLAVVLLTGDKKQVETVQSDSAPVTEFESTYLFDFGSDTISYIRVNTGDETYAFSKRDDIWSLDGRSEVSISTGSVNSLASSITNVAYSEAVSDGSITKEDCGITDGSRFVTFISGDKKITLYTGINTTDGLWTYVMTDESDTVYLADIATVEALFKPVTEYRNSASLNLDFENISAITVKNGTTLVFQKGEANADSAVYDQWRITSPVTISARDEQVKSLIIDPLKEIHITDFVSDLGDFENYGLGNKDKFITLTDASGKSQTVYFSENKDGNYYISVDDKKTVYSISYESAPYVNLETKEIFNRNIHLVKMADISNVTLKGDGYDYTVEFAENGGKVNGKDVSFDAMNQSVFASVCGLFADDILLDASGEPVVTLTFNYQNGKNDVITFSDYNERYYSVAKNGETKYMILKAKISDLAKVLDECK
ncbi:MAG: DUF4340 domain-containing protein [Clostridia bacterium]|nr:DUF4340 domain-containing protein [Clostridia bacterium]